MKKILSLLLCIILVFSFSSAILAADFTDVDNHKNEAAIDTLNTIGLIEGYGNDVFGPEDPLTRAQLCTMLVRAMYNNDTHYNSVDKFTDVSLNHWARMYIDTAYRNGLMVGNGDGTFTPDNNVTYTEVARTLLNSLGYGVLEWPNGVNLVALELGLYKDVSTVQYDNMCTRADAAQMIYNAFDLELVKDYAGIPMKTGKTFIVDILGYIETTEVEDGHEYVAYMDVETEEIFRTNMILTSEILIYSAKNGAAYRLEDSTKAPTFEIDWEKTPLYVNDTVVDKSMKTWLKNSDIAFGIFDNEDNLVAIRVINPGLSYVSATGLNEDKIPEDVMDEILDDEDFDDRLSTVTYYEENDEYEISNEIIAGFVTKVTRTAIYVDRVSYRVEDPSIYEEDDFVVMYLDVHGIIADIMIIEDPYYFNLKDRTYHTWECEIYNDRPNNRYWVNGEDAVKTHEIALEYIEKNDKDYIKFYDCECCHTSEIDDIYVVTIVEDVTEPEVTYVSVDGWEFYHVENCNYILDTSKETFEVDVATTLLKRHDCCN